jgi:DNA-binding MarR family transcriptional regulator
MNIAVSQPVGERVDPLSLDNQLCFALYAASHAIKKAYRPLLDELGLTYPQYLVLLALWQDNALKVSDIGQRLHLDSGTLTPVLKRLEKLGLVTRARRPQDERAVEISLTPEGWALRPRALAAREEFIRLLKMPDALIESLRGDLTGMIETLDIDP